VRGEYQTLAITDTSADVLRGQQQVMLRSDLPVPKPPRSGRRSGSGTARGQAAGAARAPGAADTPGALGSARLEAADLTPEDTAVFEKLRAWRTTTAREQSVPAYVVFSDATLRQIAVTRPATQAGLFEINGVGEAKLAKYGEAILRVLADQLAD
jgi:ATP-dependent DNA helicase RecQ